MKRLFVAILCVLLESAVCSQQMEVPELDRLESERVTIGNMRQQKTAKLDADDSACLSKFATTDCQNKVEARRRQMLSELKRQEADLNARERLIKGQEQLQRGDENAADRIVRDAKPQADASSADKNDKADKKAAQEEKILNHQQQVNPAGARSSSSKATTLLDPLEVEKNRAAYLEKQQALEKRRKDRDQRLLDHGNGGPPLPLNP